MKEMDFVYKCDEEGSIRKGGEVLMSWKWFLKVLYFLSWVISIDKISLKEVVI